MDKEIKRTVLITGSTSGIGLGLAEGFAGAGYRVVFNGLEPDGPQIAAAIAERYQVDHLYSPANMRDPDALYQLVSAATARFGGVDILINNAGIQYVSPIASFPAELWEAIIAINLTAAYHLTKAVWEGMQARGFGRIINIASAHGLTASPFKSAYVAAKHGLVGFTKTAALEGAEVGITCNAVCPGYVETPLVKGQLREQAVAHGLSEKEVVEKIILAKHAIKQFVRVETIAALCLYLASDAAATVTGAAFPVDAGWTAQ